MITTVTPDGPRFFWAPAKSQLYALLPRLVEQGLLTPRRVEQVKRPDKTLYRITAAGRRALREGLEQAPSAADRNPFDLRLFFGEHMRPGAVRAMAEARLEHARSHLAELERIEQQRFFVPADGFWIQGREADQVYGESADRIGDRAVVELM